MDVNLLWQQASKFHDVSSLARLGSLAGIAFRNEAVAASNSSAVAAEGQCQHCFASLQSSAKRLRGVLAQAAAHEQTFT